MKNKQIIRIILMVVCGLILIATAVILFTENSTAPSGDTTQDQFDAEEADCKRAAKTYVDLKEEEAVTKAEKENRSSRVLVDGQPLTDDYAPSRLNFTITDGVVTKAECF